MNPSHNISSPEKIGDLSDVNNCPVIFLKRLPTTSFAGTVVLCVVNILSSFTASTTNFLVLWAIVKTPSLHIPSSVPLFALSLSDFATGIIVQPVLFIHHLGTLTNNFTLYCISGAVFFPVGCSFAFVSFWQIASISFDRYLALVLHLRYATIITVRRVIISTLLAAIPFFPVSIYFWFSREDWFRKTAFVLGATFGVIGIIIIPFSYWQIFTILCRHQKQIQTQNNITTSMQGMSQMDISKYRKSVLTILYILGAILLSYLPSGVSHMLKFHLNIKTNATEIVQNVGGVMVLLNSSINPVVYCWRIKKIRQFVMSKLQRVFGVSGLPGVNQVRPVNIPSCREAPV